MGHWSIYLIIESRTGDGDVIDIVTIVMVEPVKHVMPDPVIKPGVTLREHAEGGSTRCGAHHHVRSNGDTGGPSCIHFQPCATLAGGVQIFPVDCDLPVNLYQARPCHAADRRILLDDMARIHLPDECLVLVRKFCVYRRAYIVKEQFGGELIQHD